MKVKTDAELLTALSGSGVQLIERGPSNQLLIKQERDPGYVRTLDVQVTPPPRSRLEKFLGVLICIEDQAQDMNPSKKPHYLALRPTKDGKTGETTKVNVSDASLIIPVAMDGVDLFTRLEQQRTTNPHGRYVDSAPVLVNTIQPPRMTHEFLNDFGGFSPEFTNLLIMMGLMQEDEGFGAIPTLDYMQRVLSLDYPNTK